MILILTASLMFSGCSKLELNYVIEENGTVEASYLIALEDQAENLADIQHLMDSARQQADINGFSIYSYHEDGYTGLRAAKTMKIENLRQAGSDMLGFQELPSIITDYSWHYKPSVFRDVYQLRMAIDLRNLVDQTAVDALPSDLKELALEAIEKSTAKINITLPGQSVKTNAEQTSDVKGKNALRYSWTLRPGEFKTLIIEAALDKSSIKNKLIWGLVAAAGLLILLTCFITIRKIKKK
jgi:hypothetical protein